MKGLKEFGSAVRAADLGHRLTEQLEPVFMVIFVRPSRDRQPMLLVLDKAPEEVIQRAQGVDLQHGQRIAVRGTAAVLEPPGDRVYALDQHALLVPVVPEQLDKAWIGELGPE